MKTIIKTSAVKIRRRFDLTSNLEAVRNWLGNGRSAAVVAEDQAVGEGEGRLFA